MAALHKANNLSTKLKCIGMTTPKISLQSWVYNKLLFFLARLENGWLYSVVEKKWKDILTQGQI